jgi:hypothetical protein
MRWGREPNRPGRSHAGQRGQVFGRDAEHDRGGRHEIVRHFLHSSAYFGQRRCRPRAEPGQQVQHLHGINTRRFRLPNRRSSTPPKPGKNHLS